MNVLAQEHSTWWRLPDPLSPELLRATYRRRSFARHSHDRFAIGVIESGGLSFTYRGRDVLAPAGWVNLAYPGEAHTGHSADASGWSYRMFYLDPQQLLEASQALDPRCCRAPFISAGAVEDPDLAARTLDLHRLCEDPFSDPLARQSGMAELLQRLVERHGADPMAARRGKESRAVATAREYLESCFAQPIQLVELAAAAGLNPYRLVRCFTRELGLPPHAFLVQVRLQRAATLLRSGVTPCEAALEAGFADQSHLHRHFRKCYGVTPGQYRR